jgi:NTE family protein
MRALVLSGGGANGAYQVGALQHILGNLGREYDILVGTSVGALNCAYLSQFKKGQEKAASEGLCSEIWDNVRGDKDIYRKHYYGLLWHLPVIWKNSVYTTAPLTKLVEAHLDLEKTRSSGKELRVVGVSWDSGESTTWTQEDPDLLKGVLASSAFPMFFEDVWARGQWWTDGGLREVTPLKTAIRMGASEIDVIICSPDAPQPSLGGKTPGKLKKLSRLIQILLEEVSDNDITAVKYMNRLAKAGYAPEGKRWVDIRVLRPSKNLGDSLDFSQTKNRRLVKQGFSEAQAVNWEAPATFGI